MITQLLLLFAAFLRHKNFSEKTDPRKCQILVLAGYTSLKNLIPTSKQLLLEGSYQPFEPFRFLHAGWCIVAAPDDSLWYLWSANHEQHIQDIKPASVEPTPLATDKSLPIQQARVSSSCKGNDLYAANIEHYTFELLWDYDCWPCLETGALYVAKNVQGSMNQIKKCLFQKDLLKFRSDAHVVTRSTSAFWTET